MLEQATEVRRDRNSSAGVVGGWVEAEMEGGGFADNAVLLVVVGLREAVD